MTRQTQKTKQHKAGYSSPKKKALSRGRGLGEGESDQNKQHFSVACKRTLLAIAIASLLYQNSAIANPRGGKVVAGSAQIIQKSPGKLDIIQKSHKAVINWRGFSIARGEHTRFIQPSSSAIALNRVRGGQASLINGALTANGNVWLINPNGVLFGKGAQINVRGLMATTSDINNDDFMAGRYLFNKPTDNINATIVNQGQIEVTDGGSIVLAAHKVSNEGTIKAKLGHVVLASGDTFTMDFHGDGLLQFDIGDPVQQVGNGDTEALVSNPGKITVDGGIVEMTARTRNTMVERVINMEGIIQARAVGVEDGTIILSGGEIGTVTVSGTLDVSGTEQGQVGGVAKVLGEKVGIIDGAEIDASGDAGGGDVLVGGNLHGAGPEQNARETLVADDVFIHADALSRGDGGTVAVWADESADINGTITARGGSVSGNGGFIETSGKQFLKVSSSPDASASNGKAGTWLIDPTDIRIVSPEGTGIETSFVAAETINNALNNGTSVTLDTSTATNNTNNEFPLGNITQESGATISKTDGVEATLTLQAENNIILNDSIVSIANKLNVVLNSDRDTQNGGAIIISPGSEIRSNGGDIIMGGGSDPLNEPAIATENSFINNSDGSPIQIGNGIQIGASQEEAVNIDAGGGDIKMTGRGRLDGVTESPTGIAIFGESIVQTLGDGNIRMNGFGGEGLNFVDGSLDVRSRSNAIAITESSEIITADGNIELIGVADGDGRENNGVLLQDSKVTSTGTGSISIEGTGGGGNFANRGIYIEGEGTQVLTDSGSITLTGTGGQNNINDSDTNDGVSILNGGTVESQSSNITITGIGGFGRKGNQGINLGSTTDDGIGAAIRSNGGNIELNGTGQGEAENRLDTVTFEPGNRSHGIAIYNNGVIETSRNGSIQLDGKIESSELGTSAVFLSNFGDNTQNIPSPKITSENGNIDIKGIADGQNGSGNTGIFLAQGGSIESSGAGSINMEGVGGNGRSGNHGVIIQDLNTVVKTTNGNIGFTGTGGDDTSGDSGPTNNDGISIFNSAKVEATGLGNINFVGSAGQGELDNQGIAIGSSDADFNTIVKTNSGDINLVGMGGNSSSSPSNFGNHGVFVFDNGTVESDSGSITIEGSSGQNGKGIFAANVFTEQSQPVRIATASIDSMITLRADQFELRSPTEISGSGVLQLEPLDPNLDISVSLSDAIKDGFSEVFIGHENGSGTVTITSDGFSFNDKTTLRSPNSGGQVGIDGDVQTNGNDLALVAGSAVDVNADITTSGGALDISTAGNIDTTAGVLNSSAGSSDDAGEIRLEAAGNINAGNIVVSSLSGNGGDITIISQNGAISSLGIDAGSGTVELSAGETTEATNSDLTLNADVVAQSVSLKAGDAINQTAGFIQSRQLGIEAESQTTLASADIDVLAARITGAGNGFSFSDPNSFALGQVGNIVGITTNNGSVDLQVENTITFNENVATNGGDFSLIGGALLASSTSISTNGGNINFNGLVNGNFPLTLAAGNTGNIHFFDDVGNDEVPLGPVNILSANNVTIDGRFVAGDMDVRHNGNFTTGEVGFLELDSLEINPDANSANLRGIVAGAAEKDTALEVQGPENNPNFTINDCVIGISCFKSPIDDSVELRDFPVPAEPRPSDITTPSEILLVDSAGLSNVLLVMQRRRPSNNPAAYQYSNFGNTEMWDDVPGAYSISSFAAFSPVLDEKDGDNSEFKDVE